MTVVQKLTDDDRRDDHGRNLRDEQARIRHLFRGIDDPVTAGQGGKEEHWQTERCGLLLFAQFPDLAWPTPENGQELEESSESPEGLRYERSDNVLHCVPP